MSACPNFVMLTVVALCAMVYTSAQESTTESNFDAITATIKDVNDLVSNLTAGYNKDTLPTNDLMHPFQVKVQPLLLAMEDLAEVEEKLASVLAIYFYWKDESMKWDSFYNKKIINLTIDARLMWTPDIKVINMHHGQLQSHILNIENKIVYYEDGEAIWSQLRMLQTSCNLDTTFFPFDIQVCFIRFNMPDYMALHIEIIPIDVEQHLDGYVENGMWDLSNYTITGSKNSTLTIKYVLKRRPLFMIINVLCPISVLALLTPMVFMLPKESGERVGFAVTILLAISVYMTILSGNLPQNYDPMPIVSVFLFTWYMLTTSILFLVILNYRLYSRENSEHIPSYMKRLVVLARNWTCCMLMSHKAKHKRPRNSSKKVDNSNGLEEEITDIAEDSKGVTQYGDITWVDVSSAMDIVCVVCLYVIEIGSCLVLFVILALHRLTFEA